MSTLLPTPVANLRILAPLPLASNRR
jgi:hypothetical protein